MPRQRPRAAQGVPAAVRDGAPAAKPGGVPVAAREAAPPAKPGAGRAGDPVLDDAVARVRELSLRLWAVRAVHQPARSLLGGRRCSTCGQAYPCRTVQAAGPPTLPRSA